MRSAEHATAPLVGIAPGIAPTRSAYAAYVAYVAYVENGMAMRLRRKRKTGCYRVLQENVAIPMIQNHQESPFCAIIDVPR